MPPDENDDVDDDDELDDDELDIDELNELEASLSRTSIQIREPGIEASWKKRETRRELLEIYYSIHEEKRDLYPAILKIEKYCIIFNADGVKLCVIVIILM